MYAGGWVARLEGFRGMRAVEVCGWQRLALRHSLEGRHELGTSEAETRYSDAKWLLVARRAFAHGACSWSMYSGMSAGEARSPTIVLDARSARFSAFRRMQHERAQPCGGVV